MHLTQFNNSFYHGTTAPIHFKKFKLDESKDGDIGIHFGSLKQAQTRLIDKNCEHSRIIEVKLDIKNPFRMRDISHFTVENIKYELSWNPEFNIDNVETLSELRSAFISAGYDSIVYLNEKEVFEATTHIQKSQMHLNNLYQDTGYTAFNIPTHLKMHPEYLNYLTESKRIEQMVNHFSEDSVIVLDPNQVNIVEESEPPKIEKFELKPNSEFKRILADVSLRYLSQSNKMANSDSQNDTY